MNPSKMLSIATKRWISVILPCLLSLNLCLGNEIVELCKEKACNVEIADATNQDLRCNTSCRQQQCFKGCTLWQVALVQPCLTSCGNYSDEDIKVQFCVLGCQRAVDAYEQRIKEKLGHLHAPYFQRRTATSVVLRWNRMNLPNVTYNLQRRYANDQTGAWVDHTDVRWLGRGSFNVTKLHPFVTYRFRIVAVISNRTHVNSDASTPIATEPYGVPESAPSITSLVSSSTSVRIRWASPFFKNGKLLGYRLCVRALNGTDEVPIVKDIQLRSNSSDVITEIVTMLEPNTNYEVTVSARNKYGDGPEAKRDIVTLPKEKRSGKKPYLIMGSRHKLRQIDLEEESGPDAGVLYNNSYTEVIDVAIHYYQNYIFFSNTSGTVYRLTHGSSTDAQVIYTSAHRPHSLSVDWLHNKLYIGEDNRIVSCSLDGSPCYIVLDSLPSAPLHIVADPYNGYLFWSHAKPAGLYRIDLADLGTSVYDPSKYLVVHRQQETFRTFAVDYVNCRFYYPVNSSITIRSSNLDGTEERDIRPTHTIQTSMFANIVSMVVYNEQFYWTNGDTIFYEDCDSHGRRYHNMLYVFDKPFNGLNIWHPSAQPIPVPLQPPRNVQAIFSSNATTLSWDKPEWAQGRGAWQAWLYQVETTDILLDQIRMLSNITSLYQRINYLRNQSPYRFRVRAYSSGGYGPWSNLFYGETLKDDDRRPYLVYSISGTIYQVGLDGTQRDDTLQLDSSDSIQQLLVVNRWYIWLDSQHFVYIKQGGISPAQRIPNINKVLVIAYDWLGEKLYWWNTRNQISRSSLDGHDVENVYQGISPAYHLSIDSVEGYMYWATANTVEVAHLDNKGHRIIRRLPQYSSYILGLTLDLDHGLVYWLAKENKRAIVYSSSLLSRTKSSLGPVEMMSVMWSHPNHSIQGLHYYSNRLFWLSSDGGLVVMDTTAHNVSRLELPSHGHHVASLSLVNPITDLPSDLTETVNGTTMPVIPAAVQASSVNISGSWSAFTLSWEPTPVPNQQVYYTVQLTFGQHEHFSNETYVPYLRVENQPGIRPFIPLRLTMQSCSHWGCSDRAERNLMTPMAHPSPPQKPRGFVTFQRTPLFLDYTVDIELHWERPQYPNGLLVNYTVMYQKQEGIWHRNNVTSNQVSFSLSEVLKTHIYKFKVSTCNIQHCSNNSEVVLVDTSHENPVPKLITTNGSKISLFLPDAQRSSALHDSHAIALTFEAQESALYLLDTSSHIVKLLAQEDHEVLDVAGRGKSIAMDWVGRDLYWMEEGSKGFCEIRAYNLDSGDIYSNRVLQMNMSGANLDVHPYQSSIFWSVQGPKSSGAIMRSHMNGSNKVTVVGYVGTYHTARARRSAPGCNCPVMPVTSVFVMDHSRTNQNEFYTVSLKTGSIWASDLNGCKCRLVVNAAGRAQELGLPPDSMAVDHMYLYWSNTEQGELHSVLKRDGGDHMVKQLEGVKQILAYGSHLQPFPDPKCLRPNNYDGVPQLESRTNTSLVLRLAPWKPVSECSSMSLPRSRYTVRYRKASHVSDHISCPINHHHNRVHQKECLQKTTYSLRISLGGLEPDKYYFVEVEADNFHTRHESKTTGPNTVFKTAPGVPSEPLNVVAVPRTPERVEVSWRPPEATNGPEDEIQYEIEFEEGRKTQIHKVSVPSAEMLRHNSMYSYQIGDLQPNTTYTFRVVAFSRSDRGMGESRSQAALTQTLALPPEIQWDSPRERSLSIRWRAPQDSNIKSHSFIIVTAIGDLWHDAHPVRLTKPGTEYNETFTDLEPNTEYAIYMDVTYLGDVVYRWPEEAVDKIKTLRGEPAKPDPPTTRVEDGRILITWTAPKDGGYPINQYKLLAKRSDELNWTLVYNGTEMEWALEGFETQEIFVFCVAAHNTKGWGETSEPSKDVLYTAVVPVADGIAEQLTVILAVFFVVIFMVMAFMVAVVLGTRFLKRLKPEPRDVVTAPTRRDGDRELATLRILPSSQTQTNTLYAINIVPTEADVAALPHFGRENLKLTKFLGSGAFGEVFEGVATSIQESDTGDTKVAVKTLRKGASGAEKEEFLKEALLMQNFRHTHILRLLGVCLENDPQFIILELMEGGDLLSYLRSARPTYTRHARLTMTDMMAICTDVAKGCKYLEDMHFVHRDLAARNCLVSSLNAVNRVVKIGDFGLARDIYKNDYYRKEGEGLLPVRWMSPESLIDGVFTTYSDVWAFGVLMWEVLTLGQQPYPARTNIEVLNYVRGGGRLDSPDNCPDDMYGVMLKCWCFSPGGRPSFNYLLSELETIKRRALESANHYTTTGVTGNKQRSSNEPRNRATDTSYDIAQTPTGPSNSQDAVSTRRPNNSPYLQPVATPGGPNKYLELLGEVVASNSHSPPGCSSGKVLCAAALTHYDDLNPVGGPAERARDTGTNSTIDRTGYSPKVPSKQWQWCHSGRKASVVDYAELSLSDDPDTPTETDSESVTDTKCSKKHYSHHNKNHSNNSLAVRPSWSKRCNGADQSQYAQIASTDSDTDNEIFDRSHPHTKAKSASPEVHPKYPLSPVTLRNDVPCHGQNAISPATTSPAAQQPACHSEGHISPFTIEGYLAPRSLLSLDKQAQSSSSINSNLSNVSIGQSSC